MIAIMAATVPAFAGDTSHIAKAGVQLAAVDGPGTLTASLMPGIGREARIAPLPKPLSAPDVDIYTRAMLMQAQGQWAVADRELGRAKDDLLKGHLLARRLLAPGAKPKYQELRAWMADYADLPQAETIHKLATAKGMKGFGAIKPPVRGALVGTGIDTSDDGANWEDTAFSGDEISAKARTFKVRLRQVMREQEHFRVESMLVSADFRSLTDLEQDHMRALAAADHLAGGRDAEALDLAQTAAERSGEEVPAAHWIAGLAQWRMGKKDLARRHFEDVANAADASGWMVAAGAYWAARANLVSHRPEVVNHWLEVAATYPRTFYGLLARQALGYETFFSWETPPFTETDADLLMRVPGTRRALALLQLGDRQSAEEELRKVYPNATKAVRQSMLVLAHAGQMPGLAVRLGGTLPGEDGRVHDAAAFPMPEWTPRGGWQVDRALVYAFVRQESAFNPHARSAAGASGLMQLMPRTAASLAGGPHAHEKLVDPEFNLSLGQQYLSKLLSEDPVNGNLLMLAAAYNAGPGNLAKWQQSIHYGNDPLLFIESIPSRETRAFVERVMTNFWIYKSRLGQTAPSLEAVASGEWPLYQAGGPRRTARN
jgi:soluble lytic murein transglycosylase-like protein